MKKIVYSPDYKEKLEVIRDWLDLRFGKGTRTKHNKLFGIRTTPEETSQYWRE